MAEGQARPPPLGLSFDDQPMPSISGASVGQQEAPPLFLENLLGQAQVGESGLGSSPVNFRGDSTQGLIRACFAELQSDIRERLDRTVRHVDQRFSRLEVLLQEGSQDEEDLLLPKMGPKEPRRLAAVAQPAEPGAAMAAVATLPPVRRLDLAGAGAHPQADLAAEGSPSSAKTKAPREDSSAGASDVSGAAASRASGAAGALAGQPAANFKVRSHWQNRAPKQESAEMGPDMLRATSSTDLFTSQDQRRSRWFVCRPCSPKRLMWDISGMLLITYDMVTIPIDLAFEPENVFFFTFMFWVSLSFWTLDVPLNLTVGYYRNGEEVLEVSKIWKRYARTWMLFDVFIVAIDWANSMESGGRGGAGLARLGKSLRFIRVARSLRLLRLVKLQILLDKVLENVDSQHLHIAVDMMKGVVFVVGLNHVIACSWYAVSINQPEDTPAWVRHIHFTPEHDISYRYLTSLHWSLTQFTPASMEVFPRNTYERLFAVCVLLFALLVFSSFLSSITTLMTQLRSLGSKHNKQMSAMRKYLRKRLISQSLSMRVLKFVEYKHRTNYAEIRDCDVPILNVLSEQLRMEMAQEICEPKLVLHPFLQKYSSQGQLAMRSLCTRAVRRQSLSIGDVVFDRGVRAEAMIFPIVGRLYYTQASVDEEDSDVESNAHASSAVSPGQWCSEPPLWTEWTHLGRLNAWRHSEVLAVDATKFAQVTLRHHAVFRCALVYCAEYVERLNLRASMGLLTDLPDDSDGCKAADDLFDALAPPEGLRRFWVQLMDRLGRR